MKNAAKKKNTEHTDLDTLHDCGIDVGTRSVYLFNDVDEDSARQVVKNLHYLDKTDGDINLVINTPGGCWDNGMAIASAIRLCKNKVVGKALGTCSSMGSIIIQFCGHRVAAKETTLVLHPGQTAGEKHTIDFIRLAEQEKKNLDIMYEIYHNRMSSVKGDSVMPYKKFVKYIAHDRHLMADQALELGLIDEVI